MSYPTQPSGSALASTPIRPTITNVSEIASANPARVGKMDTIVTYQAAGNFFQITLPAEQATPDVIQAAVLNDFKKREAVLNLVGKTL